LRAITEMRNRAKSLVLNELNRRLSAAQAKLPHNCTHNHRHPLDLRKKVRLEPNPSYNSISEANSTVGLCMYGSENIQTWSGNICEEPSDAKGCPMYQSKHTKEAVIKAFTQDLEDSVWLKANMPELDVLLWVLEEPPTLPWWKKVLLRFGWFRRHRSYGPKFILGE